MLFKQQKHLDNKHGDKIDCPTCGMPGWLDTETPAGGQVQDKAIWFNQHCGWECTDCWCK
jgi:hypothetical protein